MTQPYEILTKLVYPMWIIVLGGILFGEIIIIPILIATITKEPLIMELGLVITLGLTANLIAPFTPEITITPKEEEK